MYICVCFFTLISASIQVWQMSGRWKKTFLYPFFSLSIRWVDFSFSVVVCWCCLSSLPVEWTWTPVFFFICTFASTLFVCVLYLCSHSLHVLCAIPFYWQCNIEQICKLNFLLAVCVCSHISAAVIVTASTECCLFVNVNWYTLKRFERWNECIISQNFSRFDGRKLNYWPNFSYSEILFQIFYSVTASN